MPTFPKGTFETALRRLLNAHGEDTHCNLPDYVLSEFLVRCLSNLRSAHTQGIEHATPIQQMTGLLPDWKVLDYIEQNGIPPGNASKGLRGLVSQRIVKEAKRTPREFDE